MSNRRETGGNKTSKNLGVQVLQTPLDIEVDQKASRIKGHGPPLSPLMDKGWGTRHFRI